MSDAEDIGRLEGKCAEYKFKSGLAGHWVKWSLKHRFLIVGRTSEKLDEAAHNACMAIALQHAIVALKKEIHA